ncbi:hypothetical protein [Streptomyces lavendulocolor]|uniref:hypothetical protein n=1 Tax=Streptomyces lavendulocolor TaxID=67316 RepID=UPI003C2C9237
MDILQLLSLVRLISGVALIVVGLLVAIARTGGLVVIVSGVVWWAPLGFLALKLQAAPGPRAGGSLPRARRPGRRAVPRPGVRRRPPGTVRRKAVAP